MFTFLKGRLFVLTHSGCTGVISFDCLTHIWPTFCNETKAGIRYNRHKMVLRHHQLELKLSVGQLPVWWRRSISISHSKGVPIWVVDCINDDYWLTVKQWLWLNWKWVKTAAWTFPELFLKLNGESGLSAGSSHAAVLYPHCICILRALSRFKWQTSIVYLLANCPPCWITTREKTHVYLTDYASACMLTNCLSSILDLNVIPRRKQTMPSFQDVHILWNDDKRSRIARCLSLNY